MMSLIGRAEAIPMSTTLVQVAELYVTSGGVGSALYLQTSIIVEYASLFQLVPVHGWFFAQNRHDLERYVAQWGKHGTSRLFPVDSLSGPSWSDSCLSQPLLSVDE